MIHDNPDYQHSHSQIELAAVLLDNNGNLDYDEYIATNGTPLFTSTNPAN